MATTARRSLPRFNGTPDHQGYYSAGQGRWKAKAHPSGGVTLTDTTRRTKFAETDASWVRLASWGAAREMIAAHR